MVGIRQACWEDSVAGREDEQNRDEGEQGWRLVARSNHLSSSSGLSGHYLSQFNRFSRGPWAARTFATCPAIEILHLTE